MAVGTIAAGRIAVDKIAGRIQAEDAAGDSGAVVDAGAVAVLALLPAGVICRRRNMPRRRAQANHAGRSVGMIGATIGAMIAEGRDRIAEDRIADSNRVDLRIAGRKIPGMARVLQWDRVSIRAKKRSCCPVNRWRNIAASRHRLRLLRWWNKNR